MGSSFRIRAAVDADAGALARFAELTFRAAFEAQNSPGNMRDFCESAFGPSQQLAEIRDDRLETWLAEDGRRLAGFAQLRQGETPDCIGGAQPLEIQRLYVHADWHGRGVAHELMSHLLHRSRQLGADVAWLGVWEHNPRAVAFYRKFRFEPVGEHMFMLGDDPQRDVLMRRTLAASSPPAR